MPTKMAFHEFQTNFKLLKTFNFQHHKSTYFMPVNINILICVQSPPACILADPLSDDLYQRPVILIANIPGTNTRPP